MNVLIIGWYGTETIGDRAILSSLFRHFSSIENCNYTIASIYPFYTERTLLEDKSFISKISILSEDDVAHISIIDSRNPLALTSAIKKSDCVVMGGGPFDDMATMYMIEYAVITAKKNHKKTIMYGIGFNVLKKKEFIQVAKNIISYCDLIIFRDAISKGLCINHYHCKQAIDSKVLIDPAVFSCLEYKKVSKKKSKFGEYIAINLRKFPKIYSSNSIARDIDTLSQKIITSCIDNKTKCLLIPMNYFDVGIDDRIILNEFRLNYPDYNFNVIGNPLNLEETFSIYSNASMCFGMRFHSVVFQTILNGNNIIIDYTDPKKGKTLGFVNQMNAWYFYKNRYCSLQDFKSNSIIINYKQRFHIDMELIKKYDNEYRESIKELLCIK